MTNSTSPSITRNSASCIGLNIKSSKACSAVCKENSEPAMTDKTPRTRRVAYDDASSSWAFIQKIMAINEKHDNRKKERQRQKELLRQSLNETNHYLPDSNCKLADTLSRWLRGQVLDDENPEENQTSEVNDDALCSNQERLTTHTGTLGPINTRSKDNKPPLPRLPTINTTEIPDINAPASPTSSWDTRSWSSLPRVSTSTPNFVEQTADQEDDCGSPKAKKKRQLRLPPILLPRVYTTKPRPLQYREFLTPTKIRGPITDTEWEELQDCRYLRNGVPRFALQLSPSRMSSSLHF